MKFGEYSNLLLRGGFLLVRVVVSRKSIQDALGRPAVARTIIVGSKLDVELSASNLDAEEVSISLYHEILEACSVASDAPPSKVQEMNEADFESAARKAHLLFGPASPATLNQMLEYFGF